MAHKASFQPVINTIWGGPDSIGGQLRQERRFLEYVNQELEEVLDKFHGESVMSFTNLLEEPAPEKPHQVRSS